LVTVKDISQEAIIDSLSEVLSVIETNRQKEREYLLDFYEGINLHDYIQKYFGTESLQQVPIFEQNLTKRVCSLRSQTYRKPPKMNTDSRYLDHINESGLIATRRQLERLTFLLGSMCFRSRWSDLTQQIEYENISFFEPLFLPGEGNKRPWGIMYAIENQGMSKMERTKFAIWTEDRPEKRGMHFLIDSDGNKESVNPGDVNPYGLLPVVFTHRYQPIRDFYVGGANDLVSADLAISVALTELSLCIRYGAIGIKYITNCDDSSRITLGVDKILYLPENSSLGVTAPSGNLNDIVESTKFMVMATLQNNHIRIKYSDVAGNAPSAESLRIQEIENTSENEAAMEDIWRPFEKARYNVDRKIIEVQTGIKLSPDYSCDFSHQNYPMTTMDEIAYWSWRFENNLAEPVEWFDFQNPDALEEVRQEFIQRTKEKEQQPTNRLLSRLSNGE
jgi:hypothetical protein